MHFDHERIPERVVHARAPARTVPSRRPTGSTTCARGVPAQGHHHAGVRPVLDRGRDHGARRTPPGTCAASRRSSTPSEGNFDLVGNNIPVFFIQDGIKFPDLIHAAKPEPDREIPQAQTAHDTFWDFVSLQPESTHMLMWVMSDRAIPRSYATMEGFGVHTFRLVAATGPRHW